jgi:hypothetical protein
MNWHPDIDLSTVCYLCILWATGAYPTCRFFSWFVGMLGDFLLDVFVAIAIAGTPQPMHRVITGARPSSSAVVYPCFFLQT